MEIKFIGSLAIVLTFVLASSIYQGYDSNVSGQDNDQPETVQITQSNESWPIMVVYELREVFFQDEFLECTITNLIPEEFDDILEIIALELNINNGNFSEYEGPRTYHEYYSSMRSHIRASFSVYRDRYYVLKPQELDINFEMTLTFMIWNGSQEIYREEHVFSVIGEPEVIPGIDPNKDSNINIIYSLSILISLVAVIVVHRLFRVPPRKKG